MDLIAKTQYMETLRERYLRASKREKGRLLDEYCRNTGEDRKYAIKKFRYLVRVKAEGERKQRTEYYDGRVKAALATLWSIFDFPCGQRLEPLLKSETDRLRIQGELCCTDEVAVKLTEITSSTIDLKLAHEREVMREKRKYRPTHTFPLRSEVPVKTSADLDREHPGAEQIDCVEHCGASASGEYINSLSLVDVYSGWWEGDAVMGKGQERALLALTEARERSPFDWKELHPDNGGNLMNYHLYEYAKNERLVFSRSRPYQKNDNCFVEQKNSTHVRRQVGYLRYDTEQERAIMSTLYRQELRLYKNFFQPVIKLLSKTRLKGKIKKTYDTAKTPYQRLMESDAVSAEQKKELNARYESLNPAELKRQIDLKLAELYRAYQKKTGSSVETNRKKLRPTMVSSFIIQPNALRCHS